MKTISVFVCIGKSKKITDLTFLASDFVRIENDMLYLKNDERRLKLDYENKMQLLYQLNLEEEV